MSNMTTIKLARRSANYSKAELNCLVKYLEENPELISSKLGGKYHSSDDIRLAWEELADQISSLGGYFGNRRTGQEIKRKWADLKSRVKAKAASLAIETDKYKSENPHIRLTPIEERVLAIISRDLEEQSQRIDTAHSSKWPLVKVFSFPNESNMEDKPEIEDEEVEYDGGEEIVDESANESGLMEEMKLNSKNEKKRRISEAFTSPNSEKKALSVKKVRITSEEEQLQALCNSQLEVNGELKMIKELLKKTQQSIEKIAVLQKAKLRLKCAKYGVEFEDLFD